MLLPEEDGEMFSLRKRKRQGHSLFRRRKMFNIEVF